jgi:hypothetical protein
MLFNAKGATLATRPLPNDISGNNNSAGTFKAKSLKLQGRIELKRHPGAMRRRRQVFVLRLTPLPGTDPIRSLRRLLKIALSACGLRCLSVRQDDGGAT